jgi:isoleucyl-tRNA synthetase
MIHSLHDEVKKALETARADKVIGSSLESEIVIHTKDTDLAEFMKANAVDLTAIFIASSFSVDTENDGVFKGTELPISITVKKASGGKCLRCWTYSDTVGKDSEHPDLCARCKKIITM